MEIVINLIPIAFFTILFKVNREKNHNLVNMIFNATLCAVIIIIVGAIVNFGFKIDLNSNLIGGLQTPKSIVLGFLFGALLEEVIKFIFVKKSKPYTNRSILINAIIIGLVFKFIESEAYYSVYSDEQQYIIKRMLISGHVFYQTIMALLLIKANNDKTNGKNTYKLYNVLALLIPIILHEANNLGLGGLAYSNLIVEIIFAIIGYGVPILAIFKVSNDHNEIPNTSKNGKSKGKLAVLIIFYIFLAVNALVLHFGSNVTDIGEFKEVNGIKLKINYINNENIDYFGTSKEVTIVNVTIRNDSNETFVPNFNNFSIANKNDGKGTVAKYIVDDNALVNKLNNDELKPGEEVTGNIYFDKFDTKTYKFEFSILNGLEYNKEVYNLN